MTNPTPPGQVPAIQRYSIGYHSDEGGVRSLSPASIYDDAGPWVRHEDHAAALCRLHAENEALRAQQPAPDYEAGWKDGYKHGAWSTQQPAPATQQVGEVVAYLDIGAGGYLDLGSELSEDALQQLPKGRHALVIAGTYGIDGYVAAPQPSPTAQADSRPTPAEELDDDACRCEPSDYMRPADYDGDGSVAAMARRAARAPAESVTAPAGGGAVVEWHAPGLGEVHNESHGQLIFCTDGDDVADDTLARRVCAALNATPPAQAADSVLEDAARLLESQHTWLTNVAAANLVRSLAARKQGGST